MFPAQWRTINKHSMLRECLQTIIINAEALKSFTETGYKSNNSNYYWQRILELAIFVDSSFNNSISHSITDTLFTLHSLKDTKILLREHLQDWNKIIYGCNDLLDSLTLD